MEELDTFFNFDNDEARRGAAWTFGVAEPLYKELLEQSGVKEKLPAFPQKAVLLGCGYRESLEEFLRFTRKLNPNSELVIADLSGDMLKRLKRRARGLPKDKKKDVEFIQTDAREIGLADNSVDAIFTNLLLHNISRFGTRYNEKTDHIERLFREVFRILKPGGGIFLAEKVSFWSKLDDDWRVPLDESNVVACQFLKKAGFDPVHSFVGGTLSKDEYLRRHNISPERIREANYVSARNWLGKFRGGDYVASFGVKPGER